MSLARHASEHRAQSFPHRHIRGRTNRTRGRTLAFTAAAMVTAAIGLFPAAPAQAANESVNIWLTTTNDGAGRNVTRGLAQQTPVTFASNSAAASQTITVNENTTYQTFVGAGASFTDTAAWLMNSSGALSANGTGTAAMSPNRPPCTTSSHRWWRSTPSTPVAPGSRISRTRT